MINWLHIVYNKDICKMNIINAAKNYTTDVQAAIVTLYAVTEWNNHKILRRLNLNRNYIH